jgi:two-component system sensor histidine kinase BaeS
VDLTAHLKETIDSARIRSDEARVRIEADLEPTGLLQIDPDRVAQVVTNLIDNALRYTPEGGRMIVCLTRTHDGARIVVADDGPGIEPSDLPHVFERLYVAQRYRVVRPEGSGLGLSIIKELVDAMGGTVEVASTPGAGTSIVVSLAAPESVRTDRS